MINSVRLENFKNFRDATLHLGPFTVIVGTNASGKSNLRDAFRFLHGMGRGYSLSETVGAKYEAGALQWTGIRGGARGIARYGCHQFTVSARHLTPLGEVDHGITVDLPGKSRPLRVRRESLAMDDGRVCYEAEIPKGVSIEGHKFLNASFPGSDAAVEKLTHDQFLSTLPLLGQVPLRLEIDTDTRALSAFVYHEFQSMRFLDLVPEAMRIPSLPGQPLGDRGENLSSVLLSICDDETRKHAMMEWVRQLTPIDVVDFEFPTDQAGKVLLVLVEANGHRTSAESASDGTLRFLALVAALLTQEAAFYFLEEIETGIHPARMYLLIQLIEQFTGRGKVQVVTTTHSPQLLAMLSEESREHAHLVYRGEHEADAQLRRIMDIPSAREVLQKFTLARLHESGWFENTMAFTRDEEPAA